MTLFTLPLHSNLLAQSTWTGLAGTNNWGDAANWSPASVPTSGTDVMLTGANTINVNVAALAANLTLNNAGLTLTILSGNSLTVSGSLTLTLGTLNTQGAFPAVTGAVNITGGTVGYTAASGSQTVAVQSYVNLTISGGGTKTLAGTITPAGDLTVSAGIFDLTTFTCNRFAAGGTLTVSAGATLRIGGTNSVPANYSAHAINATGTIEFSGTSQNIPALNSAQNYGNLTISGSGTKSLTAGVTVTTTLTLTAGTLSIGANTLTLNGAISTSAGTLTGGATSSITFGGSGSSTTLPAVTLNNLTMNRSNGITIGGNITVGGALTFTNGVIATNANNVYISSTGSVSRTSGHVNGNLRKFIATGAPAVTFEVGSGGTYRPVNLSFASVTTSGDLTVFRTSANQPNLATSTFNQAETVTQYWTLTNSGIVMTSYSATFNFTSGDLAGGANPLALYVGRYSAGWTYPTVGTRTSTSTQATGITGWGDFQLGDPPAITWDGGAGTNNWGDAANWNPDGVPVATSDVDLLGANTINVDVAAVAFDLTLNNASLTLTVLAGNSLTLGGSLTLTAGTLNTQAAFPAVTGTTSVAAGTVGFTGSGAQTIPANNYNNLTSSSTGARTLSGTIGVAGTFTPGTNAYTITGSTVTFNGGTQTVPAFAYNNLTIGTAGTKTLGAGTTTVAGNLSVSAGTFDLGSLTADRTSAGGTLTVSNGATLRIGGTNTIPANYSTHSIGATSTVEFYGTNQNVPALNSAQSYGSLTISGSGTKSLTGSETVRTTLTLTAGTLSIGATTLTISGAISTTGGSLTGGGTSNMVVSGAVASTTLPVVTLNNFTMNRANGITLGGILTVTGTLTLTSGVITTGANSVQLPSPGTVSRTGGYVNGFLEKDVATGSPALTFEVGDAANYTPVSLSFTGVTTGGDLTVNTASGDHPNISTSPIDAAKTANRRWTLTGIGEVFTSYNATFTYVAGDVDAGATTANFIVARYSGSVWTNAGVGTRTATTTQGTGVTGFGDFQLGEPATMTWDGGAGTNNWGDAVNWNPDCVPTTLNDVSLTGASTINANVAAVAKSLTLNNSGLTLTILTGNSLSLSGNLTLTLGTLNTQTSFPAVAGTVTITGGTVGYTAASGTQTVPVEIYSSLAISGGGTKSLAGVITPAGDLSMTGGTFDLGSFTCDRASAGGTLTLANGAALKIGGTNTVPANYSAHSVGATSTIEFSGSGQSIPVLNSAQAYGNLTTSGSGTKTPAAGLTVAGALTIGSGTTFTAGSFVHVVQGDWLNSGTFSAGTGTVQLTGSANSVVSGTTTFNIMTINKSSGTNTVTLNNPAAIGTLNMTQGTLVAGSAGVTITSDRTGGGIITGLITRTHVFSAGTSYAFEVPFNTITFNAGGTLPSSVTVNVVLSSPGANTYMTPIPRYYVVSQTGGSSFTYTLRLHWVETEITPPNSETSPPLKIWQRTSTGPDVWVRSGATANDLVNDWVEVSGMTSVGTFGLSSTTVSNMVLTMGQDNNNPPPGAQVTYTVSYSNTGDAPATSTIITTSAPPKTHYVAGTVMLNGVAKTDAADGDEVTVTGAAISVNLGTVAAGASGTITFKITID